MKICTSCQQNKDLSEFGQFICSRDNKQYIKSICKLCFNQKSREFYNKNKDQIINKRNSVSEDIKKKRKEYHIIYCEKNKEKLKAQRKARYLLIREERKIKRRQNYLENREQIIKSVCEYKKNNRDKINQKIRERMKNDPQFRLREKVRRSIKMSLKRNSGFKNVSALKSLNYSIQELKEHLEKLFEPWMNWQNWGMYIPKEWNNNDQTTWKWNIDHIIPQSDLPYISMEDENFKKCWSLENLRPYSAKQNIIDGPSKIRHKKVG